MSDELKIKKSERMIILLYLIVILGWALLILIIKCRKAREKRIALAQQEAQTQNAIHVIQIGNTVFDLIPITNASSSSLSSTSSRCQHHSHCRRAYRIRQTSSSNLSIDSNAHTNPTFVLDEGIYPSAPPTGPEAPPTYDEVIRLPNRYPPKSSAVTPTENPPTYIEDIEAHNQSITTITSSSPAVFSSSNNFNHQQCSNSTNQRNEQVT